MENFENKIKFLNEYEISMILTAFENAIVEKYGFEYNDDSARISWSDLDKIRDEVKNDIFKYIYTEEYYKERFPEKYLEHNKDEIEAIELD